MTSTTQDLRVRIFGQADWVSYYGPTEKLGPAVEEVLMSACPFNKGKLVKDTHFAFMGMPALDGNPLTVAKWLELHSADGQPKFYFNTNPWHVGQPHTDIAVLEPRLYIMLREIVPGSTSKTPEEQVAMLPPEYEVPTTIAEVTKDILVYRRTGKRSNPNVWAACAERTVKTAQVNAGDVSCVGIFGGHGLSVIGWGGLQGDRVGVGASLKVTLVA
ncbi:MAG: hypothetical protein WC735_03480 [Candidatus Paceibacterota bacterium]|jgi:hypothetical protein